MAVKRSAPARIESDKASLQQLDRILSSRTFQQVDRLKRFLSFIVIEASEGRSDHLKEYVVGVQVFGKEPSFDPRTDPVVRVQARRLRARLVQYYRDEGQADELVIEMPKGGYAPVFRRREARIVARRTLNTALLSGNSVVVLPFSDASEQGSLDYFCKGLREEIIHRLTVIPGLRVLASDSADPAGSGERAEGRSAAAVMVTGSVRTSGERLRITTHAVDGASGCYLWSDSIDGHMVDTFTAQEKIAEAVGKRLEAASSRGAPVRATENLAAHNLYLQGRYHLNQRTEEGLHKAVEFFEKALVEDAEYALAHSGLADAYTLLGHYAMVGPAEVWTKAASSAASAVMLDANSAEAHTSLAHVKSTQDWDWPGAEREFLRAIGLDRRYPTAHHWYAASCLAPMGRLDEALEQMQIAQSLDPVSSIIARDVAVVHYYKRDFDAALEICDQTIELNPHFSPAYWTLGLVQQQRQDYDEAVAALQRAVHLSPNSSRMQAALARALALSGDRRAALKLLRTLEELGSTRYVSPFDFASIHFGLGQHDAGFDWLTKAARDRSFELISINVDPRFDALRADPRFQAISKQVGLD